MPDDVDQGLSEVALERSLKSSGVGAKAATGYGVPVIDLRHPDGDAAVTAALWDAATSVGFFTVVNHGIDLDLIDAQFAAAEAFFAQPLATKEAQSPYARERNSGFEHMKQVRPSTGLADVKESIQVTAAKNAMDGRWPAHPPGFEPQSRAFVDAAHALGRRVLTLLEPRACPANAPGTLAAAHTLWGDQGQCTLRMLHYPEMTRAQIDALPPGSWRAGAHTDWCCVTLLFQRPGEGGLECAANPRNPSGITEWAPVEPTRGGIAVNVGDMLSRWSDGRLLSNLHRVRMPEVGEEGAEGGEGGAPARFSLAFFMQADKDALVECAEHPPITAGDYILGRIKSNFDESANATQKKKSEAEGDEGDAMGRPER